MKTRYFRLVALAIVLWLPVTKHHAAAQSGSWGNTYIASGGKMSVFGIHHFLNGGNGILPGIVKTQRATPQGYLCYTENASWTGASSTAYVDGYIRSYKTGTFIFPVGQNGHYAPVSISASSIANPADAAYFHLNPGAAILPAGAPFNPSNLNVTTLATVSNIGYWDINGTTAAKITLYWDASFDMATFTGNDLSLLAIAGWNGTQWEWIPSSINTGATLTAGNIATDVAIMPNTYNVYTFGIKICKNPLDCIGLPVTITEFTARRAESGVNVQWITASEINNDYFSLEKSIDGINYYKIGTIWGKGNSNSKTEYLFFDAESVSGISYYRLKQFDFDGTYAVYGPVSISSGDKPVLFTVYPNPLRIGEPLIIEGITGNEKVLFTDFYGHAFTETDQLFQGTYILTIDGIFVSKIILIP